MRPPPPPQSPHPNPAEYIWCDGQEGKEIKGMMFNELRSKTKCLTTPLESLNPADFPDWSYDGSSTGQAEGNNSDCIIRPVRVVPDPIRGAPHLLIMTEVLNPDGTPHETNTRAPLAALVDDKVKAEAPLFGFEQVRGGRGRVGGECEARGDCAKSAAAHSYGRHGTSPPPAPRPSPTPFTQPALPHPANAPPAQEYTMLKPNSGSVVGWPEGGYPAPQGPFYCGVGVNSVFGRPLAEAHMEACLGAGLTISGINAEVMPGQWEFQIGPVGPLEVGDEVHLARWMLHRLGEDYGISCT